MLSFLKAVPSSFRTTSAALSLALISSGCIQVHLQGPVESADVTIKSMSGGTTHTGSSTSEQYWNLLYPQYDSLAESLRLSSLGQIIFPDNVGVTSNRLYLVTAEGGFDVDNDLDGSIDSNKVEMQGQLHAYIPGSHLTDGDWHMSVLTEAAYAKVDITGGGYLPQDNLDEFTRNKLLKTDLNNDGVIDYLDVLLWTPDNQSALLYPDDIAELTLLITQGFDTSDWMVGGLLPYKQEVFQATISGTRTMTATWGDMNSINCSSKTNIQIIINPDGSVQETSSISNYGYDSEGMVSCSPGLNEFQSTSTNDGGVQFNKHTGELTIWRQYDCPFTMLFDGTDLTAQTTTCDRTITTTYGKINDSITFL